MQNTKSRPLSPHITIYKPQISSMLSIMHRATGIALILGFIALMWWVICIPFLQDLEQNIIWKFFSQPTGKTILIIWSYSLFFHFCSGIRHLFWDCGKGFSIKALHISGWFVVICSIALTAISWFLALGVKL